MPLISNLEKEASLALSGAEYVRQKLNALAGLGPVSLYSQVYAIKLRVKSIDSLVKKTIDRRKKKPTYSPADATDLVGMRLLSIYANDLPNVVLSVLSFIKFCQTPSIQVMSGSTLDDTIQEIKVYKSSQTERIYDSIYDIFLKLRLSEYNKKGEKKVSLITYRDSAKSYSSVHILCECTSYSSGAPKAVPVEIQIRTIFEDTWGEIDHQLEYKLIQALGKQMPARFKDLHRTFKDLLDNLKVQLEQAGNNAEKLRDGYSKIYDSIVTKSNNSAGPMKIMDIYLGDSFRTELISISSKNSSLKPKIDAVINSYAQIERRIVGSIDNYFNGKKIISSINNYISVINNLPHSYNDSLNDDSYLFYFVKMETAICRLWQGLIIAHFEPQSFSKYNQKYKEAQDIYFELEQLSAFKNDPFLLFRLSVILDILGEHDVSEMFLFRSIESLGQSTTINNPQFYVLIPHLMGMKNWERRSRLLEVGVKNGSPRINKGEQISLIEGAIYYGLYALCNLHKNKIDENLNKELVLKLNNNLICYSWELRDLCQSSKEFSNRIKDIITQLRSISKCSIRFDLSSWAVPIMYALLQDRNNARFQDTAMKFYHLSGDRRQVDLTLKSLNEFEKSSQRIGGYEDGILSYSLAQIRDRKNDYKVALLIK
jgi:ppGpp synthetase/RelA/SpoT-type nucleotidyltranferase